MCLLQAAGPEHHKAGCMHPLLPGGAPATSAVPHTLQPAACQAEGYAACLGPAGQPQGMVARVAANAVCCYAAGLLWMHLQPSLTRQLQAMPQASTGKPGRGRGWLVTQMLVS